MKVLPIFLIVLLLLPVIHPCRGAVVCAGETTGVASCDTQQDDCCAAEMEQHTDKSEGNDHCADECQGYCCATIVTPQPPAPIRTEYTFLQIFVPHEPTLRFYDVAHLIWQPPRRG